MTLTAPRPDRTLTPHTYAVPIVRELPSSLPGCRRLLLRLVAPETPSGRPESSSLGAAGAFKG